MNVRISVLIVIAIVMPLFAGKAEDERLKNATTTLTEMAGASDKGVPASLLNKAVCAIVVPGVKKGGLWWAASTAGDSLPVEMARAVGPVRQA